MLSVAGGTTEEQFRSPLLVEFKSLIKVRETSKNVEMNVQSLAVASALKDS